MFDQPLLLDMNFLGTPQLCGGVYILFFFKVSFEKHPSVHAVECALCTTSGIGFNSCVPAAFFAALQRVWVVDAFARALNKGFLVGLLACYLLRLF